jgi:PGF-pre-PGF domain-containing protein
MTVEGLTFQDNGYGVGLFSTRDSSIEGCTITDTYDGIYLSNVSGIAVEGCSITSSGMGQWLIDIDGASNSSFVGNTLTGYGDSSLGIFGASGVEITGNTVMFTDASDDPMLFFYGLINSTVTENLLDFSGVDSFLYSLRDDEIYLNDITLRAQASVLATEQAASSSAASFREISAGHARTLPLPDLFDPDVSATDVYTASGVYFSSGNIWHAPDPVAYRYDGVLYQNITGNHWNLYNGTDADDDGIGDSPYVIESGEQDDYPLMASFSVYTAPLTIYVPQDVPTIGEALAIAQDGDSIVVSAGTYNESVVINRSITLSGVGMPVITSEGGVDLFTDGAVFEGFTVTGNATETVGIDIAAADIVVRDTVVTGTWIGIGVSDSGNLTLSNNTMANNTYNFAYVDTDPLPGNSIDTSNNLDGRPLVYLEGASDVEIDPGAGTVVCVGCTDVLADGLAFSDSYLGCALFSCTDAAVINTTAETCYYGVVAIDSEGVLLDTLSIDAQGEGLILSGCDGCTVADSAVSAGIGIETADSASLAISGSTVTGYYGVFGFGVDNCSLTGNTVSGEIFGGMLLFMENSTVTTNTFSGYLPLLASGTGTSAYLNSMLISEAVEPEMTDSVCQQAQVPVWSGCEWVEGYFQGQSPLFIAQATGGGGRSSVVSSTPAFLWNSPEERTYHYNGNVHTNFTGNYWSTYNGTDSNGDGIGDEGFEIMGGPTDSYPLMERFEGYAAPVAAFTAAPLTGSAPLTVRFTDTSAGEPEAWLWSFGDGATSTEEHPAHVYHAGGNHTVTLTVSNRYGSDTIVFPDLIAVDQSSTSSGGGSPSAASASAASGLVAGQPHTFSMTSGGTPVSGIVITPSTGIPSIMITVDASSLPSGAAPPAGEILQYVQINVYRASEDEIGSGEIEFTVSKAWLESLGLTPADVVIYRYHDGEWVSLPVEQTGEDASSFTFSATTPGFSVFAIGALAGVETHSAAGADVTPIETVATADPPATAETLPAETQKSPVVFAPVIALGALLLWRRR